MGFLGAALGILPGIMAGRTAGQNEGYLTLRKLQQQDAEEKRDAERQAMQASLIQAQTGYYNRRDDSPREWKPATEEEYLRVNQPAARNIDPNGPAGVAARLEEYRAKKRIDAAGEPGYDPNDPKSHSKFLAAYLAKTQGGEYDPTTGMRTPAAPAEQRLKDAEAAFQQIAHLTGPFGDTETGSGTTARAPAPPVAQVPDSNAALFSQIQSGAAAPDTSDVAPAPARLPSTTPGNAEPTAPAPKRVITQDEADYLKAMNKWDDSRYEVR